MGQALYRKYRSKSLSELVGQEHITLTLANALKNGQISHAYLFTGPRGVGKTSVARILAHEVNNLPYDDDSTHLDIIEIDAASNRRIDEIRQLRDKVNLAPTSSKYKVYIIDEVHMLTKEAFNALLKTLEEPPEHVIFILATTEAYKVPETITSRTQQFKFRPIPASQMAKQLDRIAKSEKINIDDSALQLIAEHGEGSFRDSLSLLDQASGINSAITPTEIENLLGIAPVMIIDSIFKAVSSASMEDIAEQVSTIDEMGYNVSIICKQLNKRLQREILSNDSSVDRNVLLDLMKQLIDVPTSTDPINSLEVALLDSVINRVEVSTSPLKPIKAEVVQEEPVAVEPKEEKVDKPPVKQAQSRANQKFDLEAWGQILEAIKKQHNTLYTMVKLAAPELDGDQLVIKSKYPFHHRKLSESKNKNIIAEAIKQLTNQDLKITFVVDEKLSVPTVTASKPTDENLETISNIFGNAEVIE